MENTFDKIKAFIANDRMEDAFKELFLCIDNFIIQMPNSHFINELHHSTIINAARHQNLKRQIVNGLITLEEEEIALSKIRNALLKITDEASKEMNDLQFNIKFAKLLTVDTGKPKISDELNYRESYGGQIDSNGITWINENSGVFRDKRDNHTYKIVKIENLIWFGENLAYVHKLGNNCWIYGYKGNSLEESKKYRTYQNLGCLYSWESIKTVCPNGWRIPSKKEYEHLLDKYNKIYSNLAVNGISKLDFLLGGGYDKYGMFCDIDKKGYCWTTDEYDGDQSWYFYVNKDFQSLGMSYHYKKMGLSIRCVKAID